MGNALTSIKPHEVSKDLRGYSVLFYGTPKSGKTTIASQFPGSLILGFEKGYNAIPNIKAIPVNSWSQFRKYLIDLRDEETKDMYQTIVIDTADIAYDYCTDYILDQNSAATMKDIAYGAGYNMVQREFDICIRKILQLDYGLVLISHSQDVTQKDEKGNEISQMMPTLDKRGRLVCERTCDIIGLSKPILGADDKMVTKLFLRETPRYVAGSRFKYLPDSIDFTYDNLVDAIQNAIDKEAKETGNKYVTATKNNLYTTENADSDQDFKEMMDEFSSLVGMLMTKDPANRIKIANIVNEYLGNGKKVGECTEANSAQLNLILQELRKI